MKFLLDLLRSIASRGLPTALCSLRSLLFLVSFAAVGPLLLAPPLASTSTIVVVVERLEIMEYKEAIDGFNEILTQKNLLTQLEIVELESKTENINAGIIEKIQAEQPALILTVGTVSSKYVAQRIKDLPILFSMVLAPGEASLTKENIVGASLDLPAKVQLENLESVIPHLKRVGVIYHPPENQELMRQAEAAAGELGLLLKTYPVKTVMEIPELVNLDIDVLWIIPDSIVCQPVILKRILLSSLRKRIPVMGFSRSFANSGALLAVSCDYKDIGRQAGELAARILQGENYSRLKISVPRTTKLYLNQLVANRMGINIPKKILENAAEVLGK